MILPVPPPISHGVIMLRSLKMYGMAQAVTDLSEQGAPAFEAAVPILSQLLKAELAEREVRSIAYHMKSAFGGKTVPQTVFLSSSLDEKLGYFHRHWDGLQIFLTDGRVEMDTNPVENTIRPITLNRKNALFAPSRDVGVALQS